MQGGRGGKGAAWTKSNLLTAGILNSCTVLTSGNCNQSIYFFCITETAEKKTAEPPRLSTLPHEAETQSRQVFQRFHIQEFTLSFGKSSYHEIK